MVAPETHPDRTQGGKMKAIRTHDYRIDGYRNVNLSKSRSAAGIRPLRSSGGEKEQQEELFTRSEYHEMETIKVFAKVRAYVANRNVSCNRASEKWFE
jgi:hypothetical protein